MFTKSLARILSLKDEYTFHFSNFLTISLYHSSANCRIQSETLATRAKSKGRWFSII